MAPEGQLALNIPAFTVDQLMLEHSLPHLDLAKIDVEGAELEVFNGNTVQRWLRNSTLLVLELHDDMKPGCTAAVEKAMETSGHKPYPVENREYRLWMMPQEPRD
jgi:hypothetical protein